MSLSKRFRELEFRLGELRKNLLPRRFSPTGDYSERQLDRARGYQLLAHAEIESYLEDVSRAVIQNAITVWKKNSKPTNCIVAFLASYHSGWSINDSEKNDEIIAFAKTRTKKESVAEILDLAFTQFINKLKNNHGIKTENLLTLILPTGVDVSVLDSTWKANLDNFGSKRGNTAHNTKMKYEINPKDEFESVGMLLIGLRALDDRIRSIR